MKLWRQTVSKRKKSSTPLSLEQVMTALFCYKDAFYSADKSKLQEEVLLKIQENFQQIQHIVDVLKKSNQTTVSGKDTQDILNAFARNVKIAKQYNLELFAREIPKDYS